MGSETLALSWNLKLKEQSVKNKGRKNTEANKGECYYYPLWSGPFFVSSLFPYPLLYEYLILGLNVIWGQTKAYLSTLMPLFHPSYYFHFPIGNEPEKIWFGRISTVVWMDFGQRLKYNWHLFWFGRERGLKAKCKRKLRGKLRGRAGARGDGDT